ncbi:MAG: hypothetical protein OXC55_05325 [Chloroflexi bacterium]|nr:hypothetical protein [Chloroflexota bacterium]
MKKLVIVLLVLITAAGAWIINDEVNERIAILKDNHRSEVLAIERTLSRVEQERDDARQQREHARYEWRQTGNRLRTTQSELVSLQNDYEDARSDFRDLQVEYRELESASESLRQIRAQVSSLEAQRYVLNEEIRVLRQQRASLLQQRAPRFTGPRTKRSGFYCTGSMYPAITCMDEVTWFQHFQPENIRIGDIISFYPDCWDSGDGIHTVHRIIDIRVVYGTYYFWPKGDSNFEADGCWIPAANVKGVAIEFHRNVHPLNAELHRVMITAKRDLYVAEEAYYSVRDRYCAREVESCTLPSDVYPRGVRLWREVQAARELYSCWADVAHASQYEGHIPWRC